jgi:hypothetical protein
MTRLLTAALSLLLASACVAAVTQKDGRKRGVHPPHAAVTHPAQGQEGWAGTYEFDEGGGHTAGSTGMIVTHKLAIYKRGDALLCDLDADGYQTSVSLRCDAREEGGKLNLYFDSYREGNVLTQYKKGQLLLSLEKTTVREKSKLLTYWSAYQPALNDLPSGKVYFKKVR